MTGLCLDVAPGTPGADAAYPPSPSVWAKDFEWMGRYVSSPDGNPKNLTLSEVNAVAAVDRGLAYFVEQSETTVTGGDSGNRALARQAVKLAERFGLAPGCPFWYAVDISPTGKFDVIARAFEVYNEETPDQWPVAGYVGSACGDFLLDRGLITYLHLPAATSWWGGYLSGNAHLRQHPSVAYGGSRIDRNDVLRPTPMWFPGRTHLDPVEEDDVTPEQDQRLKNCELFIGEIFKALSTPPPGTDPALPSMQWCTFSLMDAYLKGKLSGDSGVAPHNHNVTGTAT